MEIMIDDKREEDLMFSKEIALDLIYQDYHYVAEALGLTWTTMSFIYAQYEMPRCRMIEHLFGIKLKLESSDKNRKTQ